VTVTGYDRVHTGYQLRVKARRVPVGVFLELEPSVSGIKGYVEGAPLLTESTVTASVVIDDGEWVILSGLSTLALSGDAKGLPGGLGSRLTSREGSTVSEGSVLVLVRARRVYASGGNP